MGKVSDIPSDKMAREDRKDLLLEVLADTDAVLPAIVLLRNAKLRGARFEISVTRTYLNELLENGFVRKVDPERLDDRRLIDVDTTADDGYWIVTDAGRDRVSSSDSG
jgi:hypothetical protein